MTVSSLRDGSGNVNSWDYLAIRLNWLRTHGAMPKSENSFRPETFDMSQNYPNPFSAGSGPTRISYSLPEKSHVTLVVTDMLGRTVATLANSDIESGVHTAVFDAASLNSGSYIATINMIGESGLTFSKTIKMTLMK